MFIATQYMRTPVRMRNVLQNTAGSSFNIDACWGLLRTIYATNIAATMYLKRDTITATFLHASSDVEFITGEQPIVNVRATGEQIATELEFYYPLDPQRAVLVGFGSVGGSSTRAISGEEVVKYNRHIARASVQQRYARSEKALASLTD